ncbi:hypothetical protein ABZ135_36625 [Streptomyces sp. NPDC006339]|uniref:hypothetical protein n=1 Tax=Streptomyces sp. NPDC006339 TaxID=3156755 RepID=UPI0033BE74A0
MTAEELTLESAGEQPSKLAGGCVLAVGAALAGGVVYAVPEVGYTIAGALAAAGVRRARTWAAGRREKAADEPEVADVEDTVDILAVLHGLSPGGTANVRLTQLQDATGLPDTRTVRVLLHEEGIEVRDGVRASGKNGPGVHADDIPRWPCRPSTEGCWCSSDANTNTNNGDEEGPEEGFRVEHIGAAGTVVHDPAETRRRYAKTR